MSSAAASTMAKMNREQTGFFGSKYITPAEFQILKDMQINPATSGYVDIQVTNQKVADGSIIGQDEVNSAQFINFEIPEFIIPKDEQLFLQNTFFRRISAETVDGKPLPAEPPRDNLLRWEAKDFDKVRLQLGIMTFIAVNSAKQTLGRYANYDDLPTEYSFLLNILKHLFVVFWLMNFYTKTDKEMQTKGFRNVNFSKIKDMKTYEFLAYLNFQALEKNDERDKEKFMVLSQSMVNNIKNVIPLLEARLQTENANEHKRMNTVQGSVKDKYAAFYKNYLLDTCIPELEKQIPAQGADPLDSPHGDFLFTDLKYGFNFHTTPKFEEKYKLAISAHRNRFLFYYGNAIETRRILQGNSLHSKWLHYFQNFFKGKIPNLPHFQRDGKDWERFKAFITPTDRGIANSINTFFNDGQYKLGGLGSVYSGVMWAAALPGRGANGVGDIAFWLYQIASPDESDVAKRKAATELFKIAADYDNLNLQYLKMFSSTVNMINTRNQLDDQIKRSNRAYFQFLQLQILLFVNKNEWTSVFGKTNANEKSLLNSILLRAHVVKNEQNQDVVDNDGPDDDEIGAFMEEFRQEIANTLLPLLKAKRDALKSNPDTFKTERINNFFNNPLNNWRTNRINNQLKTNMNNLQGDNARIASNRAPPGAAAAAGNRNNVIPVVNDTLQSKVQTGLGAATAANATKKSFFSRLGFGNNNNNNNQQKGGTTRKVGK